MRPKIQITPAPPLLPPSCWAEAIGAVAEGQPLNSLIESLVFLDVVCRVEDTFGLEISDGQLAELKTFEDVVQGVRQLLAAKI